jgi:hypothetical protein
MRYIGVTRNDASKEASMKTQIGLVLSVLLAMFAVGPVAGCVSGDAVDEVELEAIITSPPAENVGGGGECGLDPAEQERNCPDNGGPNGSTCGRIGQACPPPPHMPHDAVCSYEQGPNGCICRCFVPGTPALGSTEEHWIDAYEEETSDQ